MSMKDMLTTALEAGGAAKMAGVLPIPGAQAIAVTAVVAPKVINALNGDDKKKEEQTTAEASNSLAQAAKLAKETGLAPGITPTPDGKLGSATTSTSLTPGSDLPFLE